jgi:hypothetical protein
MVKKAVKISMNFLVTTKVRYSTILKYDINQIKRIFKKKYSIMISLLHFSPPPLH